MFSTRSPHIPPDLCCSTMRVWWVGGEGENLHCVRTLVAGGKDAQPPLSSHPFTLSTLVKEQKRKTWSEEWRVEVMERAACITHHPCTQLPWLPCIPSAPCCCARVGMALCRYGIQAPSTALKSARGRPEVRSCCQIHRRSLLCSHVTYSIKVP